MKHRWAKQKRLKSKDWINYCFSNRPKGWFWQRQICTQCGIQKIEHFSPTSYKSTIIIAPMGGKWKLTKHIPRCEGLPSWYEAPIGA